MKKMIADLTGRLWTHYDGTQTVEKYMKLRRNIVTIMLMVTLLPLAVMATLNFLQYRKIIRDEIVRPLHDLTGKTVRSLDIFLNERSATVRFISSIYSYDDLKDTKNINKLITVLKNEYRGYIDFGLIDHEGYMVNYTGPYDLLARDYSEQDWFKEVKVKGIYISNVFLGYRKMPHIAIAVNRLEESGKSWTVRATMDSDIFYSFLSNLGIGRDSDAFLINSKGILQTSSHLYGEALEKCGLTIPAGGTDTYVDEMTDIQGRKLYVAYASFPNLDYTLVVAKPRSAVLQTWFALKNDMLIALIVGVTVILIFILTITDQFVKRIRSSDEKRILAMKELEHNQKLSSIGRLAAGVAHEINNPLAIISENAGLMSDMMDFDRFDPDIFKTKIKIVMNSVNRAKKITHRLLGFAKRIEVKFEPLDINSIMREVLGFLEKELLYKNIHSDLRLFEDLPVVSSDRGQLEQVFLNILTNAVDAAGEGGQISISTGVVDEKTIEVVIEDNGPGISPENLEHIFDPFFTTKKEKGTGLGLSITYGIIQKLGGHINVNSCEGKGARFQILLPCDTSGEQNDKFTRIAR